MAVFIDNIPPNGTLVVSVRRRATATAPAGLPATRTIYARETTAADSSELEDDLVFAPEVEEVPDATPEVEGIPETTPEVEGTSEATPETEGTPEDESIPETMPKMEDLL